MPPPFRKHLFVCLNERDPDSPKGDCTRKGARSLWRQEGKDFHVEGWRHRCSAGRYGASVSEGRR